MYIENSKLIAFRYLELKCFLASYSSMTILMRRFWKTECNVYIACKHYFESKMYSYVFSSGFIQCSKHVYVKEIHTWVTVDRDATAW